MGLTDHYEIPELVECDYGVAWDTDENGAQPSQIAKELAGFARPNEFGFGSRYEHGLRLIQMLWPEKVELYKVVENHVTGEPTKVFNWFFLETFRHCCEFDRVALTGCASSSKTFGVAVYAVLAFMASPKDSTIMISTTAGSDAERRVWGDVKELHQTASKICPVGTLLEYLMAITFDPARELEGRRDATQRDLGSGVMVIPIPPGSEGKKAIGKIIGTKNKNVIWIVEETPHMIPGFLRAESNLEFNERYQLIATGNANDPNDEHGKLCRPDKGWGAIDVDSETWMARGAHVLFLNGLKSPNNHPAIDPGITQKSALPFPYLCNPISARQVAMRNGYGATEEEQVETGKKTIDFYRFAVGFWMEGAADATLLNRQIVRSTNSDKEVEDWGPNEQVVVAGFDPGWSAGGDSNEILFGVLGRDSNGKMVLELERDTVSIKIEAESKLEFRKQVAARVRDECLRRGCTLDHLFMDISGDGGLMSGAITEAFGSMGAPVGISSLEKEDLEDRYYDVVTRLWFRMREAVQAGRIRGFNPESRYAGDLFQRRYESAGRDVVKIEPKGKKSVGVNRAGFRARVGRSPDAGDAAVYLLEGATRLGLPVTPETRETAGSRLIPRYAPQEMYDDEGDGYASLEEVAATGDGWDYVSGDSG